MTPPPPSSEGKSPPPDEDTPPFTAQTRQAGRAEEIFHAALARPEKERAAFVAGACAGEVTLLAEVEDLLRGNERTGGFAGATPPTPWVKTQPGGLMPEQAGATIGRYTFLAQIGEGGFGTVWRAEQKEPIHREVALKVIKPGMDSREIIARFEAERQALALMDHPNIAAVLDAGAAPNGRPYFVMELVKGVPITAYCDARQLGIRQRVELFIPVCQAVQHAHQKAILHRDLKPSNILLAEVDGRPVPKVIDFGIAKALCATDEPALHATLAQTLAGRIVGTPQYMSPEQAGSMPDVDTRSDIYTLGAILYELLVGETPISREQLNKAALDEVLRVIRESEARRPSSRFIPATALSKTTANLRDTEPKKLGQALRGDLDWILLKALEKDRTRRYDTANALARDLQLYLNDEPVSAGPPSASYRLRKLVRRNRLAFGAAASILVLLAAGITVSTWQAVRATTAEKLAEGRRGQAEAAATQARETLSQSDFLQALRSIHEGRTADALAQLARSLSLNPRNDAALYRLTNLLTYQSFALPICSMSDEAEVESAQFSPDGKRIVTLAFDKTVRVWDAHSGQPLIEKLSGAISVEFSPDGKRLVTALSHGDASGMAQVWDAQSGRPLGAPLRHDAPVWSAQFSSNGQRVVTASADNTWRVWDAQSGRPVTGTLKHNASIWSAQFSREGRRILSAAAAARVWDEESGQWVLGPLRHDGSVESAQFSADGKYIVTLSWDDTAQVWNAESGKPLNEPLKSVNIVQFSPDGNRIATVSKGNTARVWDTESGQPVTRPLKHDGLIRSVQFSPDGKRMVTTSDTAWLWDAQTGQALSESTQPSGFLSWAQFSPDGKRIVTASNAAWVWDAQRGQALPDSLKQDDEVYSTQFSPDGKRIVINSGSTARVCDAQSGRLLTEPMKHDVEVLAAQFSPDGTRIVTASGDYWNLMGSARVWNAQTGQPLTAPMKHHCDVVSVQFSPDGKRIVTASRDNTARVWDAQSGLPLTGPMNHKGWVFSAQFSPGGKRIVTGSRDRTARVWDAQTGQPLTEPMKHEYEVSSARYSADGKRIVTVGGPWNKTTRVWDAENGKALTGPMNTDEQFLVAQFSPDGKRIVTASEKKAVRVWDAQNGQPLTGSMRHDAQILAVQFSPDGKRIVTASRDATARVWDAASGQPLTEPMLHNDQVVAAQFSSDGKRMVTVSDTARVWDAQSGQPLTGPIRHDARIVSAQFSADGKRIVTASEDKTARVWDAQSGEPLTRPLKHDSSVASAQFSADGKRIVTASDVARVWDALTGELLIGPLKHDGAIKSAQFSPDGTWIVTASRDWTARVWDARSGNPLTKPMRHESEVESAQFSPDGKWIVTASGSVETGRGSARVWDAQSGQPLAEPLEHDARVVSAQFSPDGKRIVITSPDRPARVWDVPSGGKRAPEWLPQLAEAIAGRHLNDRGVLEPLREDPLRVFEEIRGQVSGAHADADWMDWCRWFVADRSTRTISPFSKTTVPEYIDWRVKEGTPESLDEAERLAVGNAELVKRIGLVREAAEQKSPQSGGKVAQPAGHGGEIIKTQEEALASLRKRLGSEHADTVIALNNLAHSYADADRLVESLALWTESSARLPKDMEFALKVAVLQLWFAKHADHGATCRRMLDAARQTEDASTAERAVMAYCLRPFFDPPLIGSAVTLARRAVVFGKGDPHLPLYTMVLGMAEYRQGNFSEADKTLRVAEETAEGDPGVKGTARLFHAMNLFRQGKDAEARQLFAVAEAEMKPLPTDENRPLANGVDADSVIVWLAYKEAKTLLNSNAKAAPAKP